MLIKETQKLVEKVQVWRPEERSWTASGAAVKIFAVLGRQPRHQG